MYVRTKTCIETDTTKKKLGERERERGELKSHFGYEVGASEPFSLADVFFDMCIVLVFWITL